MQTNAIPFSHGKPPCLPPHYLRRRARCFHFRLAAQRARRQTKKCHIRYIKKMPIINIQRINTQRNSDPSRPMEYSQSIRGFCPSFCTRNPALQVRRTRQRSFASISFNAEITGCIMFVCFVCMQCPCLSELFCMI